MSFHQVTSLNNLRDSLFRPGHDLSMPRPDIIRPQTLAPQPTLVSTISSINDLMRGVARATIPTRNDRYWTLTARDMWLPPKLDLWGNLGCIFITLLMVAAVFR